MYKSYSNKYQKDVACSYGYELVWVDNKFSKPFKSYLREDAVQNFIDSMIEESKYFSEVMKKPFNKELVITKKHNEDFKNSFSFFFFMEFIFFFNKFNSKITKTQLHKN